MLLLVLAASWASLVPGVEPPTARLGSDAAPAFIVFATGIGRVIRAQGDGGLLASFARPSWVMIPLNLVEQITRHCSLKVRLFGNVTSGVFGVCIVRLLAGLLLSIPLMALELLTGAGQAISLPPLRLCSSALPRSPPLRRAPRPKRAPPFCRWPTGWRGLPVCRGPG